MNNINQFKFKEILIFLKVAVIRSAILGLLFCLPAAAKDELKSNASWYVQGGVAYVSGDSSSQELTNELADIGVVVNQLSLDEERTGWHIKLGYEFNKTLAFEAGVIDLGEVGVNLTAEVSEPDEVIISANKIHPNSAYGYTLGGVYHYQLNNRWNIDLHLGLFDWQGDFDSQLANSSQQISSRDTGTDAYLGLGGSYRFSDNAAFLLTWERYQIDKEYSDTLSLGWRYYFH